MKPQPTESGNQRFKLSRIHDTEIDLISGEVVFEVELELSHDNQRLFLGLMDTHRTNEKSMSMQSGIAISINTKNGELRDPINNQNVIGRINKNSLDYESPNFLCLEYENKKYLHSQINYWGRKILTSYTFTRTKVYEHCCRIICWRLGS